MMTRQLIHRQNLPGLEKYLVRVQVSFPTADTMETISIGFYCGSTDAKNRRPA